MDEQKILALFAIRSLHYTLKGGIFLGEMHRRMSQEEGQKNTTFLLQKVRIKGKIIVTMVS